MTRKSNAVFFIMDILVMLCVGYSLFVTVFDQIISQNEGFFYALVFGGILILAYILINIVAKLMIITDKAHYSKMLAVVCFFALLGICALFAYTRLKYTSTISSNEATYYSASLMLSNGTLSVSSDLVNKLLNNPAQYLYALLFTLLRDFIKDAQASLIIVNVALCVISAIAAYLLTIHVADKLCALCAAFIMLFLPGQLFCVYSYSTECLVCAIFLCTLYFGILLFDAKGKSSAIIFGVLYCVFLGLLLLAEPVLIIFVLLIMLGSFAVKPKSGLRLLIFSFAAALICASLLYVKAGQMNQDAQDMLSAVLRCFNNKTIMATGSAVTGADIKTAFNKLISADGSHIENNIYYLATKEGITLSTLTAAWMTLGNQVAYMFVLILSLSSAFFALINKDRRLVPYLCAVIASFAALYFEVSRESHGYLLRATLSILSAIGFHYIYLNHHLDESFAWGRLRGAEPDSAKEAENADDLHEVNDDYAGMSEEDFLLRAKALIFVNENTNLYNMIKAEERQKALPKFEDNNPVEVVKFEDIDDANDVILISSDEPEIIFDASETEAIACDVIDTKTENSADISAPEVITYDVIDAKTGEPVRSDDISGRLITDSMADDSVNEPVTYIDNPLPVPVRRPHVSMDFDYDTDDSDDGWDIELTEEDLKNF